MKVRKIALLLSLVTLLTSMSFVMPVSAAMSAEDKYDILCSLGFFDSEAVYSGNVSVTKGEIITAVVNSLPEEKYMKFDTKDETGFSDISSSDPIAEIAFNARMLGIMGNKTELNPYESASLEDASFMLLNLLGYGEAAQGKYASYASGIGLTKGMSNTAGFTLDHLVIMLYNALDTDIMQWQWTGEYMSLGTVKGENYLTEILNADKGRGQVKASKFTGIGGVLATGSDSVVIEEEFYEYGNVAAADFLGNVVDYYYRENADGEKTLVFMKLYREDSTVEFNTERVTEFKDMTYTYETGANLDKKRNIKLSKSADIIYNGKLIEGEFDKFLPETGNIKLINNDSNSEYEVAIITDYEVVVVGGVDKENGIIRNMHDGSKEYSVDLYAKDPAYQVIDRSGRTKKFSDIFKNYTIYIAESLDKALTTIVISDKRIKGSVDRFSTEEITIDGIVYEPGPHFLKLYNVELRSFGTFYLDPDGRLGAYEGLVDRSIKAGYLLRVGKDTDNGDDNVLLFKLYTESGEVQNLYSAEKFYYTDGNSATPKRVKPDNMDVVIDALNYAKSGDFGGGQLILYKQNGQGRITEIEIVALYTTDLKQSEELDKRGIFRQVTPKVLQTTHKNGLFNLTSRIGEDTKVFSIPADLDNTKKFGVYTGITNCFQWNQQYTFVSFAKNSDAAYADYVLGFLGGSDGAVDENNVFVVESVSESLNDDDMPVKVISGMWGTTQKEYRLDEDLSSNTISGGDIFRLGFDDNGNVITMIKVLDNGKKTVGTSGNLTQKFYSICAYAYDFKGTTLRVSTKNPNSVTSVTELTNIFTDNMPQIYKYDSKTKKLMPVDYSEIRTYETNPGSYSKVFAWFYYADHKMMVIYD